MSYEVYWSPKVQKVLRSLPKVTSKRIILKVKRIKDDPFHFLEHYEGKDYYKLRVGNY
jgi:mRNA-degrading endonuclease RelE of RelBE toxin-antitoxin system